MYWGRLSREISKCTNRGICKFESQSKLHFVHRNHNKNSDNYHIYNMNHFHLLPNYLSQHGEDLHGIRFEFGFGSGQKRFFLKNFMNKWTNTTEDISEESSKSKDKRKGIDLSKKAIIGKIREHKDVAWQLGNLPSGQITKLIKSQEGKLFVTPSEPLLREFSMQIKNSKLFSEGIRNLNNQEFPFVDVWKEDEISILSLSFSTASRKWISEFHEKISELEKSSDSTWFINVQHVMNNTTKLRTHVQYTNLIVARSFWERKIFGDRLAKSMQKDVNPNFYPNTMLVMNPLEVFIADLRLRNVFTSYIFIIDSKGWIRWVCSGKPTERDIISFNHVLTRLCNENI